AEAALDGIGTGGPGPTPTPTGSGIDSVTSGDIPRFIARLLNPMTAPEEELLVGLTPAATRASVQQSVSDLMLKPSPAEVPALHEFNQLQIAFQPVWQEAI